MEWHDLVGGLGAAFILAAYGLLQFERLAADAPLYSLANALGAAMILVSLSIDFNLSAFIIEAFWLLMSLVGLVRWVARRPQP